MTHKKLFLLCLLSSVLLSAAWPASGFAPLLFIAFIPLLYVEDYIFNHQDKFNAANLFVCSYVTFLGWNLMSTWWIYRASFGGAAMAIITNAFLMALVFTFFHLAKKKLGANRAGLIFCAAWICFEFLHLDWDLSWPWLTLGNGFAHYHKWVQWYEYTGVLGGSLWILLSNILGFKLLKERVDNKKHYRQMRSAIILVIFLLLVPIIISYALYNRYEEKGTPLNVVVVQPNIDPYNEKFNGSFTAQLEKMFQLTEGHITDKTDYLVFPETALTEDIWENNIAQTSSAWFIKQFLKPYPALKVVTGASTAKVYGPGEPLSETARKFKQSEGYYDSFNTAIQIDSSNKFQIYHKSKLVPGVERMPFPSVFKFVEQWAIDLGGTSGSLGIQEERSVFASPDSNIKVAPVICYESIYGEYVGAYIRNGANVIFIITNDGWWGDTPGYKQHLSYARLRAIETRKSIARSANTGISCFINQKGDVLQPTGWWVPAVIEMEVKANSSVTFYVKYGDYIGRLAFFMTLVILCYSILLIVLLKLKKT